MRRLLILLSLITFLAPAEAQVFRSFQWLASSKTVANNKPVASSLAVNATDPNLLVGSFSYSDTESDVRQTPAPYITELSISGGGFSGTPQGASYTYNNLSNLSAGTPTYRWFLADDAAGTGASVVSTSSSYTPLVEGKYIDVEVTPVSSDATPGTAVRAGYIVVQHGFDPSDLGLFIDARPVGAVSLAVNTYWSNPGTGPDLTKDGAVAIPTYNVTEIATEFTAASSQNLVLPNPNPQYSKPIVIWMRIKLKSTANQTWLGISGSHHLRYNSGVIAISGASTAQSLSTGHWYILRVEISASASSSKLKVDGNSEITGIAASTNSVGTAAGKFGAISTGGSQFGNCYISHLFIVNGSVTDDNKGLMDTWFANNAPHD